LPRDGYNITTNGKAVDQADYDLTNESSTEYPVGKPFAEGKPEEERNKDEDLDDYYELADVRPARNKNSSLFGS
jgi:hypothetical protein